MKDNIFSLKNKKIIITGAAGLLGIKHAEAVAAMGGTLILIDIQSEKLKKITHNLKKKFKIPVFNYAIDITDEKQIIKGAKAFKKRFKVIDGLINNASNNPKIETKNKRNFSRLENFSINLWNSDLNVGLTGSFLCSKHY